MKPIRVGVVGLGMVAQIMHLPYLKEMDEFEIAAVCDVSSGLTDYIADFYGVEGRYNDAEVMLEKAGLDAVLVLTFHHSQVVKAAAQRGIHVFCEKPVAFSLKECDAMIRDVERAGIVFMAGYMKRYDEGYTCGLKHFAEMKKSGDLRLIHVRDACFQNDLAVRSMYQLRKFDDVPKSVRRKGEQLVYSRLREGVGNAPKFVLNAYRLLLETGSHDVNVLRGAFGDPRRVLHTEIWPKGNWLTSTLDYAGQVRCVLDVARTARNWGDEHITAIGMTRTVSVRFPNPFHKNEPTLVRLTDMEGDSTTEQTITASHSEAFKNELLHFHACVKRRVKALTGIRDARADTALMQKIIKRYKKS